MNEGQAKLEQFMNSLEREAAPIIPNVAPAA